MKTSRSAITSFLASKKIAIAGVSRDSKKFGHAVFKELTQKGFDVYPINPNTAILGGIPCFQSVSALPSDVNNLVIITPKSQTAAVVSEAVAKGITGIWIQQTSETPEALKLAQESKVNLVARQCILMWADPVSGFHKFHKTLKRIFGGLPR